MELTRTNRSGGLTTYISGHRRFRAKVTALKLFGAPTFGTSQATTLGLEVRREKVQAITPNRIQVTLLVSGLRGCNAIKLGAHQSAN